MFKGISLYGFILGYVVKFVIVIAILLGTYLIMDNMVSSSQLVALAESEDGGIYYNTTKQEFAEQFKVKYLDAEIEDTGGSAANINSDMVDDTRNPWHLPWYQGFTMSGGFTDFDLETELGKESGGANAYANGVTKPITYMDTSADRVDMGLFAALWADKTKIGDKSSEISGFNENYHKTIKVSNSSGEVGNVAIADNRVIVAVGPRLRALITGETFKNPPGNSRFNVGKFVRGAYIDVQFEDGTVLACIVGEAKSQSDNWEYNYIIHNNVSGGCLELLTVNSGLSGNKIKGYQTLFGKQRIKNFRVYTDARCLDDNTNAITYYFSEGSSTSNTINVAIN